MSVKNPTIEEKLTSCNIIIENSLNDTEILDMVTVFGYTSEKLNEGKALLEVANGLYLKQKNEYGEKFAASDELEKKWDTAHKAFMVHLGIARVALKSENSTVIKLGLNERRKTTIAAWLLQTTNFYTNVLADENIKTKLAAFSITEEKLNTVKSLVDDVSDAIAKYKKEKGEAENATKERDEAIEELDDWIADYKAIARIAFEEKPQLIEKLGIIEKS